MGKCCHHFPPNFSSYLAFSALHTKLNQSHYIMFNKSPLKFWETTRTRNVWSNLMRFAYKTVAMSEWRATGSNNLQILTSFNNEQARILDMNRGADGCTSTDFKIWKSWPIGTKSLLKMKASFSVSTIVLLFLIEIQHSSCCFCSTFQFRPATPKHV